MRGSPEEERIMIRMGRVWGRMLSTYASVEEEADEGG